MKKLATCLVAIAGLIGTPVLAADMAVKAPPPVAPVAPVTDWTGFYVGAQVGGAGFDPSCSTINTVGLSDAAAPCAPFGNPSGAVVTSYLSGTAFIGGAKIGYDWQFWSHAVVGVVGDFDWTNLNGTKQTTFTAFPYLFRRPMPKLIGSLPCAADWAGHLTACFSTRPAVWPGRSLKPALALLTPKFPLLVLRDRFRQTKPERSRGFEYRVSQNFSVVGELLWYGFGTTSINVLDTGLGGVTFTTQFNNNDILVGTLGANWRF